MPACDAGGLGASLESTSFRRVEQSEALHCTCFVQAFDKRLTRVQFPAVDLFKTEDRQQKQQTNNKSADTKRGGKENE